MMGAVSAQCPAYMLMQLWLVVQAKTFSGKETRSRYHTARNVKWQERGSADGAEWGSADGTERGNADGAGRDTDVLHGRHMGGVQGNQRLAILIQTGRRIRFARKYPLSLT